MPIRQPLPSVLASGAFTVAQALQAGVSRGRLRGRDLDRSYRGVRTCAHPNDVVAKALAYAPKLRAGECFSHGTALALAGLPVSEPHLNRLDVSSPTTHGRARGAGVRGHELSRDARLVRQGPLLIVHPVDAWCEVAADVSHRELVVLGDALVRRQHPLASLDDLRDAVAARTGRRGVKRLRIALEHVRERTDSRRETLLRLDAVEWGLPEPIVNFEVRDAAGRLIAIGDLAYPEFKVMFEYDGEQHRTDPAQYWRDVDRLEELAHLGWRVIRINRDHRGSALRARFARIHEALLDRGWSP